MTEKTQNKRAEACFFDKFGASLDYDVFDAKGYQRIVDEFLKYFTPKKGFKVIDFGCGTGSFTAKFLNYGLELYGIDISQNCINYAKKKYPDISFDVGDIEHTAYLDESFDIIFLSGVLHHFTDFSNVLKECYRVLKKGGIILGYDPHKLNPFMWLYRCKNSPFYSSKGVTENERPLTKREIRNMIATTGFSEFEVYSISGVTYQYIDTQLSFILVPAYNLLEKIMDFQPVRERFGSFLITYAKK